MSNLTKEAFYLQDENEFNYIIKENNLDKNSIFEGAGFYVVLNNKLEKGELQND